MQDEQWLRIDEFPDYAISDQGRVRNLETDHIKVPSRNQHGTTHVLFMHEGRQYRRGLGLMVAQAFLDPPARPIYNTPIHLNGDRTDCRAENLAWRPRWFAIDYHRQFYSGFVPAVNRPVIEVESGTRYNNSLEAAVANGLLDREILLSALNNTPAFPTYQQFRIADTSS